MTTSNLMFHLQQPQHDIEHANVVSFGEPSNLCKSIRSKDASRGEAVIQEEYDSFMANEMCELTILLRDCKNVGCEWVFRTTKDALGQNVICKARFLVKRYFQVARVDFNEIFASIFEFITIKCILTIGVAMN